MIQLLTRNLGWKLLSLLIAIVLWLVVVREPELATSLSAPVEFRNMPTDLDIVGNLPDRVRLELRGSSGRLAQDNLANVAVAFDLSGAEAGERTYTIRSYNVDLPGGVTFYRAVPSQVTLRFDRLEHRQVPILPAYGAAPAGYRIRSISVTPSEVEILGPGERVNAINEVKTDPIDLNGVTGTRQFHVQVHIGDPQVRLAVPTEAAIRVVMEKSNAQGAQ
ncbi:MAG TPA: CdaR family protein [Bryobacteraceae bacterium]|nr:CdaR family protein [Bryobacteraceae bacterium]